MSSVEQIEQQALAARVRMSEVFARSGVAKHSFYRAKRGEGKMLPLTVARLEDAIEELRKESA